jgi:putative GTP pyrophosphokinase
MHGRKKKPFTITPDNLLRRVTDLAGIRILHLHTTQFSGIDHELRSIFDEQKFRLIEGPFARTWDDEYRDFFRKLGVKTQKSPTMYTSVHYVIASGSQTTVTCEIQVRTLMEEVWGEVDHTINYPHETNEVACREQIRALARVTSSATRLVDSIFATLADIDEKAKK